MCTTSYFAQRNGRDRGDSLCGCHVTSKISTAQNVFDQRAARMQKILSYSNEESLCTRLNDVTILASQDSTVDRPPIKRTRFGEECESGNF